MKKRILGILLAIILVAFVFAGCQAQPAQQPSVPAAEQTQSAAPQQSQAASASVQATPESSAEEDTSKATYNHDRLQKLEGGFTDTIEAYAQEQGLTVEEFQALCEKAAADMTGEELAKMNAIRNRQIVPDENTLMQKVITTYDMNKYLSGEYKTPKGFVSACADVKQYKTTQDMYYGLRLDYEGTYFKPEGESYAVIRFYATNIDQAVIPKSPANGGTVEDPYPFGGAGFTTGTNGRWGSPEWVMSEFTVLVDGAQLFEVSEDGTETLRGVYTAEAGQFVPVGE